MKSCFQAASDIENILLQENVSVLYVKIAQPAVFAQARAQAFTVRAESVAMVTN